MVERLTELVAQVRRLLASPRSEAFVAGFLDGWLNLRSLGDMPPIDPDIRGAVSMREILAKHRDNPACYECHRRIDPLGFALESFDPIGAWRGKYETGGPIDTAGELPNGQRFEDVAGLKRLLLERERKVQFVRALTERLLSYACGRRMEAVDRPALDRLVAAGEESDHRFRDLIEHVVLSPTFRSK